jgi:hypothetical protein
MDQKLEGVDPGRHVYFRLAVGRGDIEGAIDKGIKYQACDRTEKTLDGHTVESKVSRYPGVVARDGDRDGDVLATGRRLRREKGAPSQAGEIPDVENED